MSATMADVISAAARRFRVAGVDDPVRDAWMLVGEANRRVGGSDSFLLHESSGIATSELLEDWISQRESRRPVSQIIGQRHFHEHVFAVTSDVLDPRPDSETLVEEAIRIRPARILDLGTGSGCLLLSILARLPTATGIGTDVSHAALEIARLNGSRLGLGGRAEFFWSDWLAGITGKFDMIISNPPYLSAREYGDSPPELLHWEPRLALTDGGDGLSAFRSITANAAACLAPDGHLLLEFGAGQQGEVAEIVAGCGFRVDRMLHDLDGRRRALVAKA